MEGPKGTIKTRKVAILAADGVNATNVTGLGAGLKKNGATAGLVAPHLGDSEAPRARACASTRASRPRIR